MDSKDLYIKNNWIKGEGSKLKSKNPSTEEVIFKTNKASEEQVYEACKIAKNKQKEWKQEYSAVERAEYLYKVYEKLKSRVNEYGEIVTKECGKEISEGKADIKEGYHMVEFAAGLARRPKGDVIESEIKSKDSYTRKKPKGVVGSITPWNFPIAIPLWHICIPLVYGNTIVFKPSEDTPKCGKILAEVFEEVDLPEGVFNMIQGDGKQGENLTNNKNLDVVQFTGSSEVGWKIDEKLGGTTKTTACEMGGNNAIIVTEKADLELAVDSAILSAFKTTGQRCVSAGRIIVHESVYEEFKSRFIKKSRRIKVGNPLNEDTFMGPMINKEQVNMFENSKNEVKKSNKAEVLLNKETSKEKGFYVMPFIYEMKNNLDFEPYKEEVFGPHVALVEYSGDLENAIEIQNDTKYGLAGSIISEDYRQINKYRDQVELGLAYANLPCIGAEVHLPFGGIKRSGNGFPSARGVIDFVTDEMAWTVNNSKDIELAQGLSSDIE